MISLWKWIHFHSVFQNMTNCMMNSVANWKITLTKRHERSLSKILKVNMRHNIRRRKKLHSYKCINSVFYFAKNITKHTTWQTNLIGMNHLFKTTHPNFKIQSVLTTDNSNNRRSVVPRLLSFISFSHYVLKANWLNYSFNRTFQLR